MTTRSDLPEMRGFGPIAVVGAILALVMIPLVIFSVPWVILKIALFLLFLASAFAAVQLFRIGKVGFGVAFAVIAVIYNPLVIFDLAAVVAIPIAVVTAVLFALAAYLFRGEPPENHDDELPERLF